jgi:uncharacterized protein YjbI with pentapeptide repeats
MKLPQSLFLAVCCALLVPCAVAQEQTERTCSLPEGWKPTTGELDQILLHHQNWAKTTVPFVEPAGSSNHGRANLCNADLRGALLKGANLIWAELSKADLRGAKLNGAKLLGAKLNGANLLGAELNEAFLIGAKLNVANLKWAELNKAHLSGAELNKADLTGAKLNQAQLIGAKLNGANLFAAELNDAQLIGAKLNGAELSEAKLNKADLRVTELREAVIRSSLLDGAQLAYADLTHAVYAPRSAPPNSFVAGIKGLETVTFPFGEEVGLVQLRELLQRGGLRDLEREATFAIENGKTVHALVAWPEKPLKAAEGIFRSVMFDWTTAYGLYPARALLLIVGLWVLLIPVYWWPIWRRPRTVSGSGGIFQIWPKDRVEVREGKPTLDNPARIEPLHDRGLASLGWSAYFSLLSAFHIGFREFSVGSWIARMQPRSFALEAAGWVRTVSGAQSLLSVYLLAMWVLTYFGRPFQ